MTTNTPPVIYVRGTAIAIDDEDGTTFAAMHDHVSVQWLTSDELRELADAMDTRRTGLCACDIPKTNTDDCCCFNDDEGDWERGVGGYRLE